MQGLQWETGKRSLLFPREMPESSVHTSLLGVTPNHSNGELAGEMGCVCVGVCVCVCVCVCMCLHTHTHTPM